MPFLYGFQDGIELQDLVLEPHLDIYKRVSQCLWQIIEIFLKLRVLRILEQKLFFRQLILLW